MGRSLALTLELGADHPPQLNPEWDDALEHIS
jgi:hypothetical protein